jgi:CheY-like chemotaxis protein
MENESSHLHSPLSQQPESAEGVRQGGASAACGDGKPAAADDRNKSLRTLVHDLRNAVAPIRNAVQLLRFRGSADPGLTPITDIIERQVNEMVRTLNALADGSRLGGGDPKFMAEGGERGIQPSAGRRILIADDNAAFLTSLSGVLREAGHEVMVAADGAQALELAQSARPDVVLLDVHMPGMNGFEVAKQLRARFPQRVMKLVLLSGSSLDETTLRGAERAGFDHCLDKIHDFSELERLLRDGD